MARYDNLTPLLDVGFFAGVSGQVLVVSISERCVVTDFCYGKKAWT